MPSDLAGLDGAAFGLANNRSISPSITRGMTDNRPARASYVDCNSLMLQIVERRSTPDTNSDTAYGAVLAPAMNPTDESQDAILKGLEDTVQVGVGLFQGT